MVVPELLKEVVKEKARSMLGNNEWRKYGRELAQELGGNEKAFLAGAIDAMIFDMAALRNPRRIPSHKNRAELIKQVLDSHGL